MAFNLLQRKWLEMELAASLRRWNGSKLSNGSGHFQYQDDPEYYEALIEEFKASLHTHDEPKSILLICLYVPIFLMAFLGNLMVILVFVPHKRLRSVTNTFLVNLALADLLVTVICIPMAVGQSIYKIWIYGEFMCKITAYLQGVSVASSVLTITALSIDRYLAIRHPMTFRQVSTVGHARKLIVAIWIIAIAMMIPILVVRQVDIIDFLPAEPIKFCNEMWPRLLDRQIYDIFLLGMIYLIPGIVVTSCYGLIGRQLWTEGRNLYRTTTEMQAEQSNAIMAGRRRVARMLIVIAILFAICWLPYNVVTVYLDFDFERHTQLFLTSLPFSLWLGHANSACNPVLYCFMNRFFRRSLKKMLGCETAKKSTPSPGNLVVQYSKMNGNCKTNVQYPVKSKRRQFRRRGPFGSRSSNSLRSSTKTSSLRTTPDSGYSTLNKRPESLEMQEVVYRDGGPLPVIMIHQAAGDDRGAAGANRMCKQRKKEMFNYMLNIPTTINEESKSPSPSSCGERSVIIPTENGDDKNGISEQASVAKADMTCALSVGQDGCGGTSGGHIVLKDNGGLCPPLLNLLTADNVPREENEIFLKCANPLSACKVLTRRGSSSSEQESVAPRSTECSNGESPNGEQAENEHECAVILRSRDVRRGVPYSGSKLSPIRTLCHHDTHSGCSSDCESTSLTILTTDTGSIDTSLISPILTRERVISPLCFPDSSNRERNSSLPSVLPHALSSGESSDQTESCNAQEYTSSLKPTDNAFSNKNDNSVCTFPDSNIDDNPILYCDENNSNEERQCHS